MSHSYLDIVKKFFLSPHSISYLNVLLRISNDSCSRLIDLKGTGLVLVPLGLVVGAGPGLGRLGAGVTWVGGSTTL